MSIEKVNQPVVSAIRYVQLSHFCQQRAVPDRVEGFTVVCCNNNNIRVINQLVRDFVKDCYNSGGGRSSSARDNHVLGGNFAKYSPIVIVFTPRLSNKPFLIRLLTTPQHLQYAATLPCNLSPWAYFADVNVSQGSTSYHICLIM